MNEDALRAALVGIRAQVDSLLLQLGAPADAGDKECPHPPEARRDLSVMGGPERFHCRACDTTVTVPG